jgi:hypothetical protein
MIPVNVGVGGAWLRYKFETSSVQLWIFSAWLYFNSDIIIIFILRALKNVISEHCLRVYPKVSGLAAWSENCKWYSSLPLGAVVSLFCEFCSHNPLCCFSTSDYCCKRIFRHRIIPETFWYTLVRLSDCTFFNLSILGRVSFIKRDLQRKSWRLQGRLWLSLCLKA